MKASDLALFAGQVATAVVLAAFAAPAQAQSLKPWRQAMISPKADAGFFLMAAKRGFDLCDAAVVTNIGEGDHLGLGGIDTAEQLAAPHPEKRFGTVLQTLVHLVSHFALHRGQISYLARLVK